MAATRPPNRDGVVVTSIAGALGSCGSSLWNGVRGDQELMIKVYPCVNNNTQRASTARREEEIHRYFARNPRFVQLVDSYSFEDASGTHVCLVYDLPRTLLQELSAGGTAPLKEPQVRSIAKQLLQALQSLHAAGMVHRNIRSGGVQLWRDGETCRVALGDFSCSRPDTRATTVAAVGHVDEPTLYVGATGNAAPEVLVGHPAYLWQSDIWSLGCLLVELAARRHFLDFVELLPAADGVEAAVASSVDEVARAAADEQFPEGTEAEVNAAKRNAARKLNLYLTRVAKPQNEPVTRLMDCCVSEEQWESWAALDDPPPLPRISDFHPAFSNFVQRMLQFDLENRPQVEELLQDPWLVGRAD